MKITYDKTKRLQTLQLRSLDFEDAWKVFEGTCFDFEDERFDYGETRMITVGYLEQLMVLLVWTQRGYYRKIISLWWKNEK